MFYLLFVFCVTSYDDIEMNLSGFIDDDNATFKLVDINVTQQPQQDERDAIDMLNYVMDYICLALGVPGNILSATIWLRRHVTSKNSSALYLAVLAINDLLFLLLYTTMIHAVPTVFALWSPVFYCIFTVYLTAEILEPLLVLSFSVERLIAISCPLQVRCNVCLWAYV